MSALAFADPVFQSQAAFRAILAAMARPGTRLPCGRGLEPPPPLAPAAAAAILALADFETPLFVAPSFMGSDVEDYLRFHTGALPAASPRDAAFAILDAGKDQLRLTDFAQGAPDYPDRSTTLLIQADSLTQGSRLTLAGPGIRGETTLVAHPLPPDFLAQWRMNAAAFPMGVDLIFAAGEEVAALPRSIRATGDG